MSANFKSTVKRGNNSGTGFANLQQHQFKLGEKVKVSFMADNAPKLFFAKIVRMDGTEGIYIPSSLSKKYGLMDKDIDLEVERISGFGTKAGDDGRIYVPCEDGKNLFLETGDIVLADIVCDDSSQTRLLKIIKRKRKNVTEFMAILGRKYSNKQMQIHLQRKLEKMMAPKSKGVNLQKTFGNALSKFNEEELAIFDGKKKPIIVPVHISYDEIALYLGAYFADGTKKGNSWGICASTPQQAHFYLKMHRCLIKDPILTFEISFTTTHAQSLRLKAQVKAAYLSHSIFLIPSASPCLQAWVVDHPAQQTRTKRINQKMAGFNWIGFMQDKSKDAQIHF